MKDFIGELMGTFVLTLFGCCSVAVAVFFGEYNSIFQIGLVWGFAVTLAIFLTRNICCAHLNPAVSVAMVNPTTDKLDVVSKFRVAKGSGPYWAHMHINDGILYLRHGEYFAAYKIK